MAAEPLVLTPVQQADQVRQVVGVLRRMEQRIGREGEVARGTCLLDGIDEATGWVIPGVREEVTERLAAQLPGTFRRLGSRRPRLALAMYNETIGGRSGARRVVRAALAEFGIPARPEEIIRPIGGAGGHAQKAA